jgi:hypothetical protein
VHASAETVFLGILEESQIGSGGISSKLLFVKKGKNWLSVANEFYREGNVFSADVRQIKWTVAFDGRNLGQLQLEDLEPQKQFINPWFYARDKYFTVKANQKIPMVENKSKEFGGWMKVPEHRPLVLVSQPHFNDPEHWKPSVPDEAFKKRLYVPLKLVMGKFNAYTCPGGPEVNELVPYQFKPEDVVIYKAYGSSIGKKIVAVGINREKFGCDGPPPPEWADNWFLVEGDNIDFIGREMTIVDAGDYDNDGRSELLFWHSGYDEDGYILIYDSFQRKSEFLWGYH